MKTITKIFGIALLAFAAAALSSCNNEEEYTPADPVDGPQVYFSNESESVVELDPDASSFDVVVYRGTDEGSTSVTLEVSDTSGLFTIPTTVSFSAGETKTTLTIGYSYNEDDFPYGTYYGISLSIPDGYNTPYGLADYSFEAGLAEPWVSLGNCTYRDDFITTIFAVDNYEYEVEIQENQVHPGLFRLVYPYDGKYPANEAYDDGTADWDLTQTYYLEVNAEDPDGVYIEMQDLGMDWGYGHFWVWSMADYYYENGYDWETIKAAGYCGTYDGELITFPESTLLCTMPDYYGWSFYPANTYGAFLIAMPGVVLKDFSVDVAYAGKYTDAKDVNYIVGAVTLGDDVESADVALLDGSVSVDDIDEAVAALGSAIDVQSVTSSGSVSFECNEGGTYTLLAVTYGDGDAQEYAYKSFTFSLSAEPWTSLGYCEYTEDFMTTFWSVENVTYEVEIQENTDTPGLFRLVNPYGEAYPYNDPGDWDDSQNWYIEINACDPDGVYIDLQDTGCDWGYGDIYVYSMAANYLDYGYPLSVVKAAGYCGTYADGVITFPTEQLLIYMPGYSSSIYYANTNGAFKVVMPSARTSSVHLTSAVGSSRSSRTLVANPEQISVDKSMPRTNLKSADLSTL
ncbi:MAG: hypothetical protein LUC24_01390 [Bacteroidales bacterium]|nr:hypothetical protein [Bacteroidales bacterium]